MILERGEKTKIYDLKIIRFGQFVEFCIIKFDPENIRNLRQELHYYPFGLEFSGPWKTTGSTKPTSFRYNGKESEPYGWDDFGARRYDPVVGRW